MAKAGDVYTDREGRLLRLRDRVDPRGDVPPFWRVETIDVNGRAGRQSTVREDRLLSDDYTPYIEPSA